MKMSKYKMSSIVFLIFFVLSSVYLYYYLELSVENICEMHKCPYCYGTDFCAQIESNMIIFKENSILDLIMNYINVKNVFFAYYINQKVVLKKLGHDFELSAVDQNICKNNNLPSGCNLEHLKDHQNYTEKIILFLNSTSNSANGLKICSDHTLELFLRKILKLNEDYVVPENIFVKNLWTTLQLNVEPIILRLLNSEDWHVPYYYGSCGRIIVQEDCGSNLNSFMNVNWNIRAYLSFQLLEAARNFTFGHPNFRFYLTDVSPDNIAVDTNFKLSFIDLEDIIIIEKNSPDLQMHYSDNSYNEGNERFAYSVIDICKSSLSDHNIYSICKLLLSSTAPWPMMENGLLHSPPDFIKANFSYLFDLIEECVQPSKEINRFKISVKIMDILQHVMQLD